jgi:hypothetical protein
MTVFPAETNFGVFSAFACCNGPLSTHNEQERSIVESGHQSSSLSPAAALMVAMRGLRRPR